MAGASGSEVVWSSVVETVSGTTPATPAFTTSPFENINISAPPNIREDRNSASGRRRSGIARSGVTITGTAAGKMIYGVYDDFWASLLQSAWAADVLVDSVSGLTSFTFEQQAPQGAGGTLAQLRYRGIEFSAAEIVLTADEDAAVSFDITGTGKDPSSETLIAGATYTPPSNDKVLGSGSDVGFVTIGALTVPCIRDLTMRFNMAEKDRQPRISSDDLCGVRRGALLPELTGTFYMEDGFREIYDAADTGDEYAVTVPIGALTGEKYEFLFPRCQIVQADIEQSDADLFQPFTIMPLYDAGINGMVQITRAIA